MDSRIKYFLHGVIGLTSVRELVLSFDYFFKPVYGPDIMLVFISH